MRKLKIALLCGALACASPAPLFAQASQAGITPCGGGTLAVTGTSSNVQLSTCGPVAIVYNISTQEAFYALGSTSATAAVAQSSTTSPVASQYSIPGNTYVVINVPNAGAPAWYLAAITATSTTTLRIVQGYAAP